MHLILLVPSFLIHFMILYVTCVVQEWSEEVETDHRYHQNSITPLA
jgi:hypothetical protein